MEQETTHRPRRPSSVHVTGGAGFIGSQLVARLLADGHRVAVIDDLSNGSLSNLRPSVDHPNFSFVKADFADHAPAKGIDVVYHLAARTSVARSVEDPGDTFDTNVVGTFKLLLASRKSSVRRFVFVSSAAVYGNQPPPLSEDLTPSPLSPYASSKVAGEAFAKAFYSSYGLETVCLRLMNVYGLRIRGGETGVVEKFARALEDGSPLVIHGSGRQTRDFVHVLDAVQGLVAAGLVPGAIGGTFNIGTGIPTSINRLAVTMMEAMKMKARIIHDGETKGDVGRSYADIAKARGVLGYSPQVKLLAGLKAMLEGRRVSESERRP